MAKLKQVIGAILCDINRARAISDAYSRDLKASYREDPFLKLLDVPRTDIKEMTIDLKFAILSDQDDVISTNKVTIYEHGNYEGTSQELTEGNYDLSSLTIGNDALSSLKVPQGMKVTLYEEQGFTGREKSFTEDTPWVGDDFNDITSSIKVEKLSKSEDEDIDVEIVTNKLASMPEATLSSISLTLDMTSV
jgi:hypothetical protein